MTRFMASGFGFREYTCSFLPLSVDRGPVAKSPRHTPVLQVLALQVAIPALSFTRVCMFAHANGQIFVF